MAATRAWDTWQHSQHTPSEGRYMPVVVTTLDLVFPEMKYCLVDRESGRGDVSWCVFDLPSEPRYHFRIYVVGTYDDEKDVSPFHVTVYDAANASLGEAAGHGSDGIIWASRLHAPPLATLRVTNLAVLGDPARLDALMVAGDEKAKAASSCVIV